MNTRTTMNVIRSSLWSLWQARCLPYLAIVCLASAALGAEEARLLRFPAIHGNQLVFTYAGDLYTASASGGVARKLTGHIGYEMFPRFSPDGKWIAFTGQYDGNTEVYLMPAEGGVPKRLTYTATLGRDDVSDRMGPNNIVMGWKDARTIVFRCRAYDWNSFLGKLCLVSIDGGMTELLPLPRGGWCSFSPDQKKLAYNRVFREFRTWKRYRGGQADDLWIYDFETKATRNLTNNPAQDIFPMWHADKIYFASDRDEQKRMNLHVFDLATNGVKKLTDFKDFDVKFPSLGDTAIVFENGGYIYRFDLKTQQAQKVPIYLHEDLAVGRGGLREVSKELTSFGISPDGNRAVLGARGDLFTVPAKHGNTRNLTGTPGVHERNAAWSPDGKWIAYVSDATGEDEIYIVPQDGSSPATQLTDKADTYKYHPVWSPDSQKLLWSDKKQRLQFVDVKSKAVALVVQATAWEIGGFCWSPDSAWIAYTKPEERQMPRIYLYSVAAKATHPVTDGWFASSDPTFSADGKYLFFVSERHFAPRFSQTEWNYAYFDMEGIYLVTLAKKTPSPFAPKSDEVQTAEGKGQKAEGKGAKKDAAPEGKPEKKPAPKVTVQVDPDGLLTRVAAFPIPGASYGRLTSVGDKLFYMRRTARGQQSRLVMFELDKQKETELGECSGYEVSADGKKMLVRADNSYAILDLPTAPMAIKERLNLGGMTVMLDREAEWRQIFRECWRQMRDFVYAPNLHGVDWPKIRATYEPLVAHVKHRADLTYVIGEMIGELNLGHCYVGGGDYPHPDRIAVGLLGAKIERDPKSGYYRIRQILKGQNWDGHLRSPLTEIGVDVKEGDYIISAGRQARQPDAQHLRRPAGHRGQAGHPAGQCPAQARGEPQGRGPADRRRAAALLSQLGAAQHRAGLEGHRRPRGLRPHPGHAGRRAQRVRQVLLSANAQGGADRRRARQRRRQRLAADHRAPAPRGRHDHRCPQRRHRGRSLRDGPRTEGDARRRVLGLRRRHRGLSLQEVQARPGDRQADLGRRGRHPRLAAAFRRRLPEPA